MVMVIGCRDSDLSGANVVDALLVPEYRAQFLKQLGLGFFSGGMNAAKDFDDIADQYDESALGVMLNRIATGINPEHGDKATLLVLFNQPSLESYTVGRSDGSSTEKEDSCLALISKLAQGGILSELDGCAKIDDIVGTESDPSGSFRGALIAPIFIDNELAGVIVMTSEDNKQFSPGDEAKLTLASVLLGSALQHIASEGNNERRLRSLAHALSAALDARDAKTRGHSFRVAMYAMAILNEIGCDESDWSCRELRNRTRMAALLHDIGKVGIPDSILLKDNTLTEKECERIKGHPVTGAEILTTCYGLKGLVPGVLYHHECFDGSGYPFGMSGDDIPFMARVITVANTFDAITSDRPFREAVSHDEAIDILNGDVAKNFDPSVLKALIRAHEKGTLKYVKLPPESKASRRSVYGQAEKIYGRNLKSVPSLPHVLNTVHSLLDDPATSMKQIGKVLSTDEGLASRVLRLVNSAYYGLPRMVSTIPLAMTILGSKAIKSHVVNIAYADLMGNLGGHDQNYTLLWRHALRTASWARVISKRLGGIDPEEAFTAGLIHDIGQALCLRFKGDAYGRLINEAYKTGKPLLGVEEEVVGFDHTQIGAWAADRWKMPDLLVNAIAWHHDPPASGDESDDVYKLVRAIHLADIAARATQTDIGGFIPFMLMELNPRVLRELGSAALSELELMQERVGETERDLESMLGPTGVHSL
jgi:putative nucleotidyltransferase with HDIG domain